MVVHRANSNGAGKTQTFVSKKAVGPGLQYRNSADSCQCLKGMQQRPGLMLAGKEKKGEQSFDVKKVGQPCLDIRERDE